MPFVSLHDFADALMKRAARFPESIDTRVLAPDNRMSRLPTQRIALWAAQCRHGRGLLAKSGTVVR